MHMRMLKIVEVVVVHFIQSLGPRVWGLGDLQS